MVLIEECRPTRIGRTTYDESYLYSTLDGTAGFEELRRLAIKIRIQQERVKFYDEHALILVKPWEVREALAARHRGQMLARVATPDEARALHQEEARP